MNTEFDMDIEHFQWLTMDRMAKEDDETRNKMIAKLILKISLIRFLIRKQSLFEYFF